MIHTIGTIAIILFLLMLLARVTLLPMLYAYERLCVEHKFGRAPKPTFKAVMKEMFSE